MDLTKELGRTRVPGAHTSWRSDKGLSLLEILISMVILAIGLLGITPLFVLSIDANDIGKHYSQGSKLAAEKVEEFESTGYDGTLPFTESEKDLLGRYNRITMILDNASDSTVPEGLARIDVVVEWPDAKGTIQSTRHATLIEYEE